MNIHTLRLCTHAYERLQICECDFWGSIDFYGSVHMHPNAICVIQRPICGSNFFGRGAKNSHSDANLRGRTEGMNEHKLHANIASHKSAIE